MKLAVVKNLDRPVPCRWWQKATLTIGRTTYEASFVTDEEGLDSDSIQVYRMKADRVNGIRGGVSINVSPREPAHAAVITALEALRFSHKDGSAVHNDGTPERWEESVEITLRDAPRRQKGAA